MAITKPTKGLSFPKQEYKKKINGQTKLTITSETFTLEPTAQFDGLHGAQLQHVPARAGQALGQTISDPVVTCLNDSTARSVRLNVNDGTTPDVGSVYFDLTTGTILFNAADAGKQFKVDYYPLFDLLDHNAMNRIWKAGAEYLVSDDTFADNSDLQALHDSSSFIPGSTVKLAKDITTTGLTITKEMRIISNGFKIIKSGTATNSKAINYNAAFNIKGVVFQGWIATGDVCVYASADKNTWITECNAIGNTKLTNADTVCTNCIVRNNLPDAQNSGQPLTVISSTYYDKTVKVFEAGTSISSGQILFLDTTYTPTGTNPPRVKPLSSVLNSSVFVGVALNAAASGASVNVAMAGYIPQISSGLSTGSYYTINRFGNLASANVGNTAFFKAMSPTDLLIQTPSFISGAVNLTNMANYTFTSASPSGKTDTILDPAILFNVKMLKVNFVRDFSGNMPKIIYSNNSGGSATVRFALLREDFVNGTSQGAATTVDYIDYFFTGTSSTLDLRNTFLYDNYPAYNSYSKYTIQFTVPTYSGVACTIQVIAPSVLLG